MASYETLEFQKDLFMHDMLEGLDFALSNAIDTVINNQDYFVGSVPDRIEIANGVEYDIHSSRFKAWILEYGKGKYLDESNPYLSEYKNTVYWNSERESHGNAILYRGEGNVYEQLDYKYGVDSYTAVGKGDPQKELPQWAQGEKPKPFVDQMFDKIWTLFGVDSIEVIQTLESNASKYFVVKGNTVR